jgi:hypothetical protein
MFKIILRVVGLLLVAGAAYAGWTGYATLDEIQGLKNDIRRTQSQMAYNMPKEKGEEQIAGYQRQIDSNQTMSYVWFGGAGVGMLAGLCMMLLPSVGQKKAPDSAWAQAPSEPAKSPPVT